MIRWIRDWLAGRRAREERRAHAEGYRWAEGVLVAGDTTVVSVRAAACGAFNMDDWSRAFDRGARSACDDYEARPHRHEALTAFDVASGSFIDRMG